MKYLFGLIKFVSLSLPFLAWGMTPGLASEQVAMVRIPAGAYSPFYNPQKGQPKKVATQKAYKVELQSFWMDTYPVTNAQFLRFVKEDPQWLRSKVQPLFADGNYLKHWAGDIKLGELAAANGPVVNVSWFAAAAYCEAQGKTLPTGDQWEYVAFDMGRDADKVLERLLEWHSQPNPKVFPEVTTATKNHFGVIGLPGFIWEWTEDFNNVLVSTDTRGGDSKDNKLFCGSAGILAEDKSDYPRFLRYGFRGSLDADYTVPNLGFRCVKEISQ